MMAAGGVRVGYVAVGTEGELDGLEDDTVGGSLAAFFRRAAGGGVKAFA